MLTPARSGRVWACIAALGGLATVAQAQTIVFADLKVLSDPPESAIRRVSASGGAVEAVVAVGNGLRGLDVDPVAGKVYWTDVDNFVIRRANLDGTGQQDLVTMGLAFPSALRLNLAAGHVIWGDQTNEQIPRCDLDGANPTNPIGGTPFFRGIAIDNTNNKIYWTTSVSAQTGRIMRANLDGSDWQIAVDIGGTFWKPGSIALDVAGGKVYWADAVSKFVRRSNLDGSNAQVLFDGSFTGSPKGITLDLGAGKIYWGQDVDDFDTGAFFFGEIRRMNLDGTDQELVVSGLGSVNDLVIVPDAPSCPADFNQTGGVTVADIFAFLTAWFANDPAADFDQQNGINVTDIFAFLTAWFAGCP